MLRHLIICWSSDSDMADSGLTSLWGNRAHILALPEDGLNGFPSLWGFRRTARTVRSMILWQGSTNCNSGGN